MDFSTKNNIERKSILINVGAISLRLVKYIQTYPGPNLSFFIPKRKDGEGNKDLWSNPTPLSSLLKNKLLSYEKKNHITEFYEENLKNRI